MKGIPDGSGKPGSAIAVCGNGTSFDENQQRHLDLHKEHSRRHLLLMDMLEDVSRSRCSNMGPEASSDSKSEGQ